MTEQWRKNPESLDRGAKSGDPLSMDIVFVYRDTDGLKAHFVYERRYTKHKMKSMYGFDIEFVAVGRKNWNDNQWQWDNDTTDHEVRDLLSGLGFDPDLAH